MISSVRVDTGTTTGGAGVSTANATSTHVVTGKILSIILEYKGSPPGTTDVVVATSGSNHPAITLLTVTNAATDGMYLVRHKVVDEANVNISYEATNAKDIYDSPAITDSIKVTVSQANDGDSVVATLVVEEGA
jgi:hypothetical protein